MSRRRLQAVVAAISATTLVTLAYLPIIGQGFQSEDYLLLRWLGEHAPWTEEFGGFAQPWLGITAVGFYRPVATWVFAAERALFGASILSYDLVHYAVHLLNCLLVFGVARRMAVGRRGSTVAALAFGLFPLAPDAVLFLASFATLFGTLFFLLALWLFLEERPALSKTAAIGACAASAAALGSYEATVVGPVWMGLALWARRPACISGRRVGSLATCVVMVLLYAALRVQLFGSFLGGYRETASVFSATEIQQLAVRCLASLSRLIWPLSFGPPNPLRDGSVVLAWAAALWFVLGFGERSGAPSAAGPPILRWAVVGGVAVVVALAPFAFQPLVPGIGRYAYLAAVALAVGCGAVVGEVWARRRSWQRNASLGILAVGLVIHVLALAEVVVSHREARRLSSAVKTSLAIAAQRQGRTCFLAAVPWFVSRRGVPYASVLRYGIEDAVSPPFGFATSPVYPLPPSPPTLDMHRVLGSSACVLEWDGSAQRWEVVRPPDELPSERFDASLDWDGAGRRVVRFEPRPGANHRGVFLTQGNATVVDASALGIEVPQDFLQTMARLYPATTVYWWVEVRDSGQQLLAASSLQSFPLSQ